VINGSGPRPWLRIAAPLSYLLLALLLVAPVLTRLGTHLPGNAQDIDFTGHIWHCWWFGHSLWTLGNPYVCDMVLVPFGSPDLLIKSGPCLNAALTAPFQPLLGPIGGYNVVLVLLLTLNAWAGSRLVLRLVKLPWVAWLTGFLFVLNPLVLHHTLSGRMDQASLGWFILALTAFLELLERPSWRGSAKVGLFTAITTLSYMGYGQMLVMLLALLLLHHAWRARGLSLPLLRQVGLAALIFLILMGPVLLTFAQQSAALPEASVQRVSLPLVLEDKHSLTLPEQVIVEGSARVDELLGLQTQQRSKGSLLPAGLLLLSAMAGLLSRRARLWGLVAGGFLLLSLGPYLHASGPGASGGLTLPAWLLYNYLPTFARMRKPARLVMPALLALLIMAGFGLRLLSRQFHHRSLSLGVPALVALLIALELWARGGVSLPLTASAPPQPSSYHHELADRPRCAVLGVPLATKKPTMEEEMALPVPHWPALEMYYQSVHGQPLIAGLWVNFSPPPDYLAMLEGNPVLADVLRIQRGEAPLGDDGTGLPALREAGFCELKLTLPWLQPWAREPMRRYLRDLLGPPQSWQDAGVEAYPLTR
jgi:hypothetical protein